MPEHVHLLVWPTLPEAGAECISRFSAGGEDAGIAAGEGPSHGIGHPAALASDGSPAAGPDGVLLLVRGARLRSQSANRGCGDGVDRVFSSQSGTARSLQVASRLALIECPLARHRGRSTPNCPRFTVRRRSCSDPVGKLHVRRRITRRHSQQIPGCKVRAEKHWHGQWDPASTTRFVSTGLPATSHTP